MIRRANGTEPAKRFIVRVIVGTEAKGELTIVGLDGSESNRTVVGQSCNDVADALALVGALSIDPLETTTHSLPANISVAPVPTASIRPTRAEWQPSSRVWIREASVRLSSKKPIAEIKTKSRRMQQGVIAETFALVGTTGSPWIGLSGRYWFAPGMAGIGRAPLRLTLGLSRTLQATETVSSDGASDTLDYRLTTAEFGACPLGGRPVETIRLWGCAFGNMGWLQVRQASGDSATGDSGTFFSLGPASRLDLKLYGALGLTAALGMGVPVIRYKIQVDSLADTPTVQLRPISVLCAIGINLSQW